MGEVKMGIHYMAEIELTFTSPPTTPVAFSAP